MSGNTTEVDKLDKNQSIFLLACKLVHDGYYNTRITWGEVKNVFSPLLGKEVERVCSSLSELGYFHGYEDDEPFMILRRIETSLDPSTQKEAYTALFEIVKGVPLAYNVALVSYLQKTLIMAIIGSFYDQELSFTSTPEERVLISAVTSDDFLSSRIASSMIEEELRGTAESAKNLDRYLDYPWFNELALIIKNGYYGNGSFNFINTLESSFRSEFINGILEILRNGGLLWMLINFRQFLKSETVDRALRNFVRKSREGRKRSIAYDWLSIGNDFAIGIEFLVGSIEFFPGYNSTAGIYLFILGSLQLFARPVITTFKKIHQRKLDERRIRF